MCGSSHYSYKMRLISDIVDNSINKIPMAIMMLDRINVIFGKTLHLNCLFKSIIDSIKETIGTKIIQYVKNPLTTLAMSGSNFIIPNLVDNIAIKGTKIEMKMINVITPSFECFSFINSLFNSRLLPIKNTTIQK